MAVVVSCAPDGSSGCVEGATSLCACPDGRAGVQVCGRDGTFGACECRGPDTPCAFDDDCDDGSYCTGAERCAPGDPRAAPSGCVAGTPVRCDDIVDGCAQTCSDAARGCVPTATDADGDGHGSAACGGDDCDDDDANRFPGNVEVCDASHDEDCDEATLGVDRDRDGFVDARCCNGARCGDDCDDTLMGANPSQSEACDGLDNDCDGEVDEDVLLTFYRDVDGDGFGVTSEVRTGCSVPSGFALLPGDCAPTNPAVHPAAADGPPGACDGVDNDCSGAPDEGCECADGTGPRECGPRRPDGTFNTTGVCRVGTQACIGGQWSAVCTGAIEPSDEVCNGLDDDCDGMVDEGTRLLCYTDVDNDGIPPPGAASALACPAPERDVVGGCPFGTTDRAPTSGPTDCDDSLATVHPGAPESCGNGRDDDCDGAVDQGCPCAGIARASSSHLGLVFGDGRSGGSPNSHVINGVKFSWVGTGPGGEAILSLACAATDTPLIAGIAVPTMDPYVYVPPGAPVEVRMRTVSSDCCEARLDIAFHEF